jgi:hypothetical protein
VIFIGIADNGRRIGVDDADGIQREIRRVAENECYPPVRCEPVVIQNSGVEIVAIIIPPSTNRPHFSGHAYVRRGSESVNASIELFDEMVASRNDKARKLLAQKGKLISARFTGNTKLDRDPQYAGGPPRKWRDYKIEHCDAHYVRFVDVIFQLIYTPSLEHVAIEFDSQQHRLQLVVTEI